MFELISSFYIYWLLTLRIALPRIRVISKIAAVGHLGFIFLPFWTTHDVPLGGLHFPCQWRNGPVRSGWDIAILRMC